ncbi:MAG: hypothetical protein RL204_2004, partial [Bacteroidota bacterium]
SSVKINGVVADEHELNAGNTFTIDVVSEDNESLNQLKVNIHSADDGHTHDGGSGEVEAPNIGVWSETQIFDLSGTSNTKSLTLEVPATVAGHWHVEVMLIDEQGNEADEYVTTLHVLNTYLPVFAITSNPVAVDGVITIAEGETLDLMGTISDTDGLAYGHCEIRDETTGDVVWTQTMSSVMGTVYDIGTFLVDPVIAPGNYQIFLKATDDLGYQGEWVVDLVIE